MFNQNGLPENQSTLSRRSRTVAGIGLHTGCQVSLSLSPAPVNTGLRFRRVDLQQFEIEATKKYVTRVSYCTTLMRQGVMISTVEHVLAALYAMGVDNAYIDLDSLEIPIMDGSAQPFVELIEEAGIEEQNAPRRYLRVLDRLEVRDGDKWISIEPADAFLVDYSIDFPHRSIGVQRLEFELTPQGFRQNVAFARTFGFYHELEFMRNSGLIRGGSFDNAIVLGPEGVMNGTLRCPDEFVRHKVLDLVGDISLAGMPILGRIRAHKAGHSLHTTFASRILHTPGLVEVVTLQTTVAAAGAGGVSVPRTQKV